MAADHSVREVLGVVAVAGQALAREWNCRSGKVHCAPVVGTHHFDDAGLVEDGWFVVNGRGAERKAVVADHGDGAFHGLGGDERFITLNVQDDVVVARGEVRTCRDFGDAVGTRWVVLTGKHALGAGIARRGSDVRVIGSDDVSVGDAEVLDALPDADDEWRAAEESERLAVEPGGAESGWDHREGGHGRSAGAGRNARFTPWNIVRWCKGVQLLLEAGE